ncbi:MAG TPA: Gfo/Idh/MocA family oxidoreductase [Candidatus Saccharimonadales bacterium]|nr:Gfo/Idh/MocA family oxidoreductase [Candidatus Saccharimonadales bacterium]
MIDLVIVGSGDVVRDRHAAILKELQDKVRVRCIVSKRQFAVDAIQEQLGYPVLRVETIDEALKTGVAAALVTVSPAATMEVAAYLTRLNIPHYLEKPMAQDAVTAAKYIEEVSERNLPVVVGENFQHQERFAVARGMCESCGHSEPTNIIVADTLRRGLRTNPRTDDELFGEQIVHSVSSIRTITGKEIETVQKVTKRTLGSATEYVVQCVLQGGAAIEIKITMTNTWSEDRYSLMYADADIRIAHSYSYDTRMYTDTVEHWHGPDNLIKVVNIPLAESGMRACWREFMQLVERPSKHVSPSLPRALRDVQFKEAVQLCLSSNNPIPVVAYPTI